MSAVAPPPPRYGSDYAALLKTIRAQGLLERRLLAYGIRAALTLGLYGVTVFAVVWVGDSWFQLAVAGVFGVAFGQVAFLGHDAGHQAIFASRRSNNVFGRLLGILDGLSFGWWLDIHNRHHANPNHVERDPNIGDGVLVYTDGQATRRGGFLSRFIARRQAWLFFPLLTLQGISMHVSSVAAVLPGECRTARGRSKRFEAIGLALHAVVYLAGLLLVMSPEKALAFVAVHQAVWGIYMGSTFAPNHKGMPIITTVQRLDYLRRQVITSRNVRGGPFTDVVMGGLNYQIEHHLFPNMPRASLRHAQPIVREYCAQLGISYSETSLLGSYRAVLTHLDRMGAPLRAATTADRVAA